MFYETFCRLCQIYSLTPSGAAAKIGFNRASVTMWKNTGKAPKQELLIKIADFFGVTTDYLLGYDIQAQIDSLAFQIAQMREELQTAHGAKKEEMESALAVLEESYEDLYFSQSCLSSEKEHKKSPSEIELTEGDVELLKAFHSKPLAEQRALLTLLGLSED